MLSISQFLSHNSLEDFFSLVTPLFIAIKDDSLSPYHSVLFWFLERNNMMSFWDIYLTLILYINFFKGKCILVNMSFTSLVYQHVGTPFVGEQNRGHTALCSLLSIFRSKYCFLFIRLKNFLLCSNWRNVTHLSQQIHFNYMLLKYFSLSILIFHMPYGFQHLWTKTRL